MFNVFKPFVIILITAAVGGWAEHHTVHFDNRCGFGHPTLVRSGEILSTGSDFNIDGPLVAAIAYLQSGKCGLNGEGCTVIETTLKNPTLPGTGSNTGISLIPPHAFSAPSSFEYVNGCDGAGRTCDNANCSMASHTPTDGILDLVCLVDDVDLDITFC